MASRFTQTLAALAAALVLTLPLPAAASPQAGGGSTTAKTGLLTLGRQSTILGGTCASGCYSGPGDFVPPGSGGPFGVLLGTIATGSSCTCARMVPLTYRAGSNWSCLQTTCESWIAEITVDDLTAACPQPDPNGYATLCVRPPCPLGFDVHVNDLSAAGDCGNSTCLSGGSGCVELTVNCPAVQLLESLPGNLVALVVAIVCSPCDLCFDGNISEGRAQAWAEVPSLSLARGGVQTLHLAWQSDPLRPRVGRTSIALLGPRVAAPAEGMEAAARSATSPLAAMRRDMNLHVNLLAIEPTDGPDELGWASARVVVPPGSDRSLAGQTIEHVFVVYDDSGLLAISEPVSLRLEL